MESRTLEAEAAEDAASGTARRGRAAREREAPAPRLRVALVGAGEMAESLVRGWLGSGRVPAAAISVTNRADDARLREFRAAFGVRAERAKAAVVPGADVVIVAVKPQDMEVALRETAPHLERGTVVVSVAAGVRLSSCARRLPAGVHLVRAMPNSSSRVRGSVTALCRAPGCDAEAFAKARWLFDQVGTTVEVDEDLFDAFTAVGASGPAYAYLLVEAMVEAGRRLGLPEPVAREAAAGAVLGAGRMLAATGLPAPALRRQVTSPGGTTEAAIAVLLERGLPDAVGRAVARAAERAAELGRRLAAGGAG